MDRLPLYQLPVFEIIEDGESGLFSVKAVSGTTNNGKLCRTQIKARSTAERWIAFMRGERMAK